MQTTDLSFYNTSRFKLIYCANLSVFFYLFLTFFLPFGVDNYNPSHQYTLAFLREVFYFFLIVLVLLLINEFFLRPWFVKKVSPQAIAGWSLWTCVLLSTGLFYLYNYLGNWHDYRFKSYLGFIINCSSVLVFPMIGTFFFFRYQALRQRIDHILTSKEESVDASQLITFAGQGSKDRVSLSISMFLYGRAQDNYVELYYLEKEQLTKFLIRASLSNLTASIDHAAIVRCHRSYMINLFHVKAVKGNQNDMRLYLGPFDTVIPVSRTYSEVVLEQLRTLKDFV